MILYESCQSRKRLLAAFLIGVRTKSWIGNGPGYRSGELNALLESEGARHVCTRAYSLWQNGKVERMNRTLAQEW